MSVPFHQHVSPFLPPLQPTLSLIPLFFPLSFACASSTSFTSEVAAFSTRCTLVIFFLFFFASGMSSSGKLGVEGRLLAEEPGVERCLLTAGAGVEGQLLTVGPGVDG